MATDQDILDPGPSGPAGLAIAFRMLMVAVAIAAVRWVGMQRRAQRAAIAEARK